MFSRPRYNDKARSHQSPKSSENTDQSEHPKSESKMSSKKRKRLEKFIERQLKKEERVELLKKLGDQKFSSNLLLSSKTLGRSKLTKRESLKLSLNQHLQGLPIQDESLFMEVAPTEETITIPEVIQEVNQEVVKEVNQETIQETEPRIENAFGSALKRPIVKKMKNAKKISVFESFDSNPHSDSDESTSSKDPKSTPVITETVPMEKQEPLYTDKVPIIKMKKQEPISSCQVKKSFFVPITRSSELNIARMSLPVVAEEQVIMEKLMENDVIVLCGETGSGKTTQVPQFLYEAGFGDPKHPIFPGMVGITEPRRVAAISMANRVSQELNAPKGHVSYQVRYDKGQVYSGTRIKFMTDGILLRELNQSGDGKYNQNGDLLLSKYSCIIIDEAHERTVGTDVLIGWLVRLVELRNSGKISGIGPLKLIIMSATLRVQDFTDNIRLFPRSVPPVINIQGRQHKVIIHYNKITEQDYLQEAFKKICKIHSRLPHGGILVFVTGQQEVEILVRKLQRQFPFPDSLTSSNEERHVKSSKDGKQNLDFFDNDNDMDESMDDYSLLNRQEQLDELDSDFEIQEDDEEENVQILQGNVQEDIQEDEEVQGGMEYEQENRGPLHVLPLYSLLPTELQLRIFEEPPVGSRLCVIATNVAETSLTIPGIKYVVDTGKVKEKTYNLHSGLQKYQIGWTSKASGDQRAGRAGRTGPGHCYRLFSSAVFNNYFHEFSKPEILSVPIEGVILQMKSVGIHQVVNFPFPSCPEASTLKSAEALLGYLGALDSKTKQITAVGKQMSKFPISPRYSKMVLLASKQSLEILLYIMALVSALSVGDPFIRDDIHNSKESDEDEKDQEGEKKEKKTLFYKTMKLFTGNQPISDALTLLFAFGAFKMAKDQSQFCTKHFLRLKAMQEMMKLEQQLHRIAIQSGYMPKEKVVLNRPPNTKEKTLITQIYMSGYSDRIAKRIESPNPHLFKLPCYQTMWESENDKIICQIHPSSSLYFTRPAPNYILYDEIIGKQEVLSSDNQEFLGKQEWEYKKYWLKGITLIESESWIHHLASPHLLKYGDVLEQPSAYYDTDKDDVLGHAYGHYGPKDWKLPLSVISLAENKKRYVWFARFLLQGDVFERVKGENVFKSMTMKASPSIVTKEWGMGQARVLNLVHSLLQHKVSTFQSLVETWKREPQFLWNSLSEWIPQEFHDTLKNCWPPVVYDEKLDAWKWCDNLS